MFSSFFQNNLKIILYCHLYASFFKSFFVKIHNKTILHQTNLFFFSSENHECTCIWKIHSLSMLLNLYDPREFQALLVNVPRCCLICEYIHLHYVKSIYKVPTFTLTTTSKCNSVQHLKFAESDILHRIIQIYSVRLRMHTKKKEINWNIWMQCI